MPPDQLEELTARVAQRSPQIDDLIARANANPTQELLDQLLAAFNEGRELASRIATVRGRIIRSSQFAKSQLALNQNLADSPFEDSERAQPFELHG